MNRFAFVVLNYQCTEETIGCIESIEKLDYKEKYIVVVDNASSDSNEFFEKVKKRFADENNIVYLSSDENTGYARGNNCGIDYARRKLNADFVCVINPDAVLPQIDFIQRCERLYDEHEYAVLGPRILSDGRDSNPLGHYNESALVNFRGTLEDLRIYFAKKYNLGRFNFVKKIKERRKQRGLTESADNETGAYMQCKNSAVDSCAGENEAGRGIGTGRESIHEDGTRVNKPKIQVQSAALTAKNVIVREGTYELDSDMGLKICGACMIFSPKFFSEFKGFGNKTFLYCEENILSCVCYHLGYKIIYSSEVLAVHEGGKSTATMQETEEDEAARIMRMELICAKACWALTRVLAHKHNKRYLKKVLNPKIDLYRVV